MIFAKRGHPLLYEAVAYLGVIAKQKKRKMFMPGDERYQPTELIPFLGYDNWASWLIIVEFFWMVTLAKIGVIPKKDAELLTKELLFKLLRNITTQMQDKLEKKTKHDIIALLKLMRKYLPKPLRRWLHYCATSYDIINTAYALQLRIVYAKAFWPKLKEVDKLWRKHIKKNVATLQVGRTHLQHALPIVAAFWLAYLHNRFAKCARMAGQLSLDVPGKFSGAVGTSASQRALIRSKKGEDVLLKMLGLPKADICTQITPPEENSRYYSELVLLSGSMANLGDDTRILQAPEFGEVISASSTSSAIPHKKANPISAENDAGMHVSVLSENMKVLLTLMSNLQRDLRWSNVMRSYSAVMTYCFQQILTTEKLLNSLKINVTSCRNNLRRYERLLVAELMHLSLQTQGYTNSHQIINEVIVPAAAKSGNYLTVEIVKQLIENPDNKLLEALQKVPPKVKRIIHNPETYFGDAKIIAEKEAKNKL